MQKKIKWLRFGNQIFTNHYVKKGNQMLKISFCLLVWYNSGALNTLFSILHIFTIPLIMIKE